MQDVKKIVVVIVLLAAIVAAVWFTVKRVSGRPAPPEWFQNQVEEKIDRKTLKVIALPREEWHKLEAGARTWKNPETGEPTATEIMICASCGEKIPWPEMPAGGKGERAAVFAVLGNYMCPKCGQHAWGGPAAGGGHMAPPAPGVKR